MSAPPLADWSNFFAAEVGASAALSGLLMVAVSINLARILSLPQLPGRAGETLMLLVGTLIVSSLALVPGQPIEWLGGKILVVGAVMSGTAIVFPVRIVNAIDPAERWGRFYLRVLLTQLASLPVVIGGIMLLTGALGGLYWVTAGVILCLFVGVLNAWVLLVEIIR